MKKKTKADIILIMVLLIVGSAVLLYMYSRPVESGGMRLAIGVHGERVFDEALSDLELPYTYAAVNPLGETNIFVIEENEYGTIGVHCEYSDCYNQICVYTGVVTTPDYPIVCLPHGVTARLYMPDEE